MPHAIRTARPGVGLTHVLDLPQLYTQPSAQDLLKALSLLAVRAPSWDRSDDLEYGGQLTALKEVPTYLTSVVASRLNWIKNDHDKELIWEAASLRLAERSGRTAMPSLDREFDISHSQGSFRLKIHEPSITGDRLGWKTWAASYLLSKRISDMGVPVSAEEAIRILELGSGTGLVGMAAAVVLRASVVLTDLPEIEANLAKNVMDNASVISEAGGFARTAILDWRYPERIIASESSYATPGSESTGDTGEDKFSIIVAADSIYSVEHPAMLVNTVCFWLAAGPRARVLIELPCREGYSKERDEFRRCMFDAGLVIVEDGLETGVDDWGSEVEVQEVSCWWSIWCWAATQS